MIAPFAQDAWRGNFVIRALISTTVMLVALTGCSGSDSGGGTPIVAVLNLAFWLITVLWFLGQPAAIGAVFPWYIYFPALAALVLGNAATLYMNMIALREDDRSDLLLPALTVPLFWLMMSIAATKGVYQLIRNPSYWEKTFHGLDRRDEDGEEPAP